MDDAEKMTRLFLFDFMNRRNVNNETLAKLYQINYQLLVGIEEVFSDNLFIYPKYEDSEIIFTFEKSLTKVKEEYKDFDFSNLEKNYSKMRGEEIKISNKYFFNKLLKIIISWSNIQFNKLQININDGLSETNEPKRGMTQIFLSYSYDDYLYTYALFQYFYSNNLYLYMDWMHNNKINDGRYLKSLLRTELDNSEQLLFLPSLNRDLRTQGYQGVRPWCAWELGCFYSHREKYIIQVYNEDRVNNNNLLLSSLERMIGIDESSNRIIGRW
ncbi:MULTISPECIES: hypothetical protein [Vagococcus]|uniref:TIR domain-containing protein n=1 Tax=Vagococcus fluvialis bH819 TaxID=1255619 RepID=A0A1X6WLD9_9ENTE|nr:MULTISPECIES: hypothetical protein [Vagococcus]SLM85153.1 hypothetical protein FM121_03580 [Vagococcus fluvialis bH819]HCM88434.1 hypothetical protein [Vagococcus sp.]